MSPEQVIQAQLDAYNAKNLDALLACYAQDACMYQYPATLVAQGQDEIRQRMKLRFAEPDLHAQLLRRVVVGEVVIDEEVVTRNFPAGRGKVAMTMIYRVQNGRIVDASTIMGEPQLDQAG
ncbi:nuclear transport factor 2 family protein [Vogesella sp. XCS3]|uniref:nuclear transport factor 2 family protein n=1 Tax=Vogesella sp. XCS3 TaxID=2877939 RepID=UPI001D0A355E|nr:nuclear transport factor 2 family protein [Vogesella sp. XCS3]UDM15836.1 nuclear transport factor 2 family protein [Vogesella sp. XCS3]